MDTNTTLHSEIGYATEINRYLVLINGLPNVKVNELVLHESKARGVVSALKDDLVEVLMLDDVKVKPKDSFTRTNLQFSVNVGDFLLGRTINPLGIPIDGKSRFPTSSEVQPIEQTARGIMSRKKITQQFETGTTTIDLLIPIAKGQRELIIGDGHSGKTSFLLDTVINRAKSRGAMHAGEVRQERLICIYALIGKPIREIKSIVDALEVNKALFDTVVVSASSSEIATLIYLTPFTALTVAEYFQKKGNDVLVILDDLGLHAKYYREISLLSGKAPGRESYPGDIFYQHAHLLERAGSFNAQAGGGSITALPIIEIGLDDLTGYIPTNLMGMTDGHIIFDSTFYHQGTRPAINVPLSVSRVGRQTQGLIQKELSDKVKSTMAEAKKLETFSRLGSEVSAQTQETLNMGKQIQELLNQPILTPRPKLVQIILLGLVFTSLFKGQPVEFVQTHKQTIINFLSQQLNNSKMEDEISKMSELDQFLKTLETLVPTIKQILEVKGAPQPHA